MKGKLFFKCSQVDVEAKAGTKWLYWALLSRHTKAGKYVVKNPTNKTQESKHD
jgi:hypothetical protein